MHRQKSFENELPSLYIVPTPIGNLEEFSPRQINVLRMVDFIAAEDTRTTKPLLQHFSIQTPLIAHHAHNERQSSLGIVKLLKEGNTVALVSDAGYPLINDPGNEVVQSVLEAGFNVIPISGSTAFLNALVASGLLVHPFLFHGFLPSTKKALRRTLLEWKYFSYTLVFYISIHSLKETLEEILTIMGDRKACLARELTKRHEEFIRGQISELIDVADDLKGEVVLILEGNPHEKEPDIAEINYMELINEKINKGMSASEAIKHISQEYKISKNLLYDLYHGGVNS